MAQLQNTIVNGTLTLSQDPVTDMEAVTKQYVDSRSCISVKDYGAVGDGTTHDGEAIANAVAAAPDGSTIIFENNKTYLCGEIHVQKNLHFDLNGSTILNGEFFFEPTTALGTEQSITTTVPMNRDYVTVSNASSFSVGDIVFITSTELYNTLREYYTKGGMYKVKAISGNNIYVSPSIPFVLNTSGSPTIAKVNALTGSVVNGYIDCNNETKTAWGIRANYCRDFIVDDVKIKNVRMGVLYWYNYNSIISNCITDFSEDAEPTDHYGLDISTCTNTSVTNCMGISGQHFITTGGEEPSINTTVIGCSGCAESSNYAFCDHDNALYTKLIGCNFCGIMITDSATVQSCTITQPSVTTNYGAVIIELNETQNYSCRIDNCTIDGDIRFKSWEGTGGTGVDHAAVIGDVTVTNTRVNSILPTQESTGVQCKSIRSLTIDNCIFTGYLTRGANSVKISNCIVSNCQFMGSGSGRPITWNGMSNYQTAPERFILSNCLINTSGYTNENYMYLGYMDTCILDNISVFGGGLTQDLQFYKVINTYCSNSYLQYLSPQSQNLNGYFNNCKFKFADTSFGSLWTTKFAANNCIINDTVMNLYRATGGFYQYVPSSTGYTVSQFTL